MAFTAAANPRLVGRVLTSPNAELIFASNRLASVGPASRDALRLEALPPGARGFLSFARENLAWPTLALCDYLVISGFHEDWEALAAFVQAQAIEDFLLVLFNRALGPETILDLLDHPEAAGRATRGLEGCARISEAGALSVFGDPHGFRASLLAYVKANDNAAFRALLDSAFTSRDAWTAYLGDRLATESAGRLAEALVPGPWLQTEGLGQVDFVPCAFLEGPPLASSHRSTLVVYCGPEAFPESSPSPPRPKATAVARRLKVLGDPTRVEILMRLRREPSYGKELAARLGLSPATVSRQLDQLKEAGLVVEEAPDGRNVKRVRLAPDALGSLVASLEDLLAP